MARQDDIKRLLETIREAAPARVWSQGVKLARDGGVVRESEADDELVVRVKVPGHAVSPTVVLYPRDQEWDCDCGTRAPACSHACAGAIVAAQAAERGEAIPSAGAAGGQLRYRLRAQGAGVVFERSVVGPDGDETPLAATLSAIDSGRVTGPAVIASDADLQLDALIGPRTREVVVGDKLLGMLALLAGASDVRIGDRPVRPLNDPILPRAAIRDAGDGVELVIERDPAVVEVIAPGVALCRGDELRPLGETQLTGPRLESLPFRRRYGREALGELVTGLLPELAARIDVSIDSERLPGVARSVRPRIALDVRQDGELLSVLATLVYGEPPQARIDSGRLVHLRGDVPLRDVDAEQRLVHELRDAWNLAPGVRASFSGAEALAFANRLAGFGGEVTGAGRALVTGAALVPSLSTERGRFDLRFAAGAREADPAEVLRAWRRGLELVPLVGGGWAKLPAGWLAQHGDRVASLLAARDVAGKVPTHALPELARLCDELGHPPPPNLARLRPLIEGFERLPEAAPPADLTATLRDYQRVGASWLAFLRDAGLGGVLADDMGLGKTLQALCAIRGRTLVVCPTSVLPNWEAEIAKFRPSLTVCAYHGPKRELDPRADITLTTYALLRNDIDALAAIAWDGVVLDEAQAIKNPDSQVARAAYRLEAGFRLTLTGTPVENRLDELWSQLHFCNRGLLAGREDFKARYEQPIAEGDASAAARLRERIRPFLLRRLKRDVAPELPPRTDQVLHVELDPEERASYDAVRAAARADVVERLGHGGSVLDALEALLRLRQACCHRGLLPGQVADRSTKLDVLVEALDEVSAEGHKALVFSQWTSLLDKLEPALAAARLDSVRLDGSTRDRGGAVARFQADDGPPVMLISLKAGGTGLNLTAADHVFLLDPWWNPAAEDQAADRAHRIGQDKPVMVYRLVARDTVEERILALQQRKRSLADAALGEGERAASLTRDDLMALLA